MAIDWVATASDGSAKIPSSDVPHPRNYGTFPRKIGHYSVREAVVPLPDVIRSATGLPADILGYTIYDQSEGEFVFHRGPIFSHIILADEINRASPRIQSALLESEARRLAALYGAKLAEVGLELATGTLKRTSEVLK